MITHKLRAIQRRPKNILSSTKVYLQRVIPIISATFILICVSCSDKMGESGVTTFSGINVYHKNKNNLRICGGALNTIDNLISGESD